SGGSRRCPRPWPRREPSSTAAGRCRVPAGRGSPGSAGRVAPLALPLAGRLAQDKIFTRKNSACGRVFRDRSRCGDRGREPGPMVELMREALHTSVIDPVAASMNFLNEVASRFPAAISLAAGRPFDEFYAVEDVGRYLTAYIGYLRAQGVSEPRIRQAVLQY